MSNNGAHSRVISAVHIVSPPGYPHTRCFDEVAEAFASAIGTDLVRHRPDGKALVFGAHTLAVNSLNKDDIIYQSEQITPECPWVKPEYIELLKKHVVWDYSQTNVDELAKRGVDARLVPIRYHPCMTKIKSAASQDIDVLFYGSTNQRRMKIMNDLRNSGLSVRQLKGRNGEFGVYGKDRDDVIARSKVVLNTHFYENGIFEIFRASHLFANSKCVVSERGGDVGLDARHAESAVFCDPSQMAGVIKDLLSDDARRHRQEAIALLSFAGSQLEVCA